MDPLTLGLGAAGLISSLIGGAQARSKAQEGINLQNQNIALQSGGIDYQKQNLLNALEALQNTNQQRLQQAGGIRTDQFGNATYYDPAQGRWITSYTPQQQRLITADQARQERTLARGAQASEDYAKERAGYLYNQPPTEATIRSDITSLLRSAQGEGERALNTLVGRWGARTAGNIPVLYGPGNVSFGSPNAPGLSPAQQAEGMTPAQELARTMLQAREQALQESGVRQQQHAAQYLPAMAAFEKTSNVVPQESAIGTDIRDLTSQGQGAMLSALADYEKNVNAAYLGGGKNVVGAYGDVNSAYSNAGNAYTNAVKAAGQMPSMSDFMALAKGLQGTGKTATAAGKTTSTGGGGGGDSGSYGAEPGGYNFPAYPTAALGGPPGTEPAGYNFPAYPVSASSNTGILANYREPTSTGDWYF